MTDLHDAAEEGYLDTIRTILDKSPERIGEVSGSGDMPFHSAIYQCQTAAAKLLHEYGADFNEISHRGRTPLHCAGVAGSLEIMRWLIDNSTELESFDFRGETPIVTAMFHVEVGLPESQAVVDLLLERGAQYGLEAAIAQADVKRVATILESAPKILEELPRIDQISLIDLASLHMIEDNAEVLKLLLDHGGDPNACDKKGGFSTTPITRIADPKTAEVLLMHGANPNALDDEGRTPFQNARKNKEKELEEILLKYSAKAK